MLRLFWISIAVLSLAAGVVVVGKRAAGGTGKQDGASAASLTGAASPPTAQATPAEPAPTGPAEDLEQDEAPTAVPAVVPIPGQPAVVERDIPKAVAHVPAEPKPAVDSSPVAPDADGTSAAPEDENASADDGATGDDPVLVTHSAAEAQAIIAELMKDTVDPAIGAELDLGQQEAPVDPETVKEAKIVEQEDGSLLVDDVYVVRGAGTKEDPYRITWDMLISAQQTYNPRLGEDVIPGRVQLLHEKYVAVTGYLAFPIAAQKVNEALVMLNQWDGCCIGVPPSPYDAVEARLTTVYEPKPGHMLRYGTVTGLLKVDPYIVNNWLVGLYLMEDGQVETE